MTHSILVFHVFRQTFCFSFLFWGVSYPAVFMTNTCSLHRDHSWQIFWGEIIWDTGDQTQVDCAQGNHPTHYPVTLALSVELLKSLCPEIIKHIL